MKLPRAYWRTLGIVAAVNRSMSQNTVNGVGGNEALLLLLGTLAMLLPILLRMLPYIFRNYRMERPVITFIAIVFLIGFTSTVLLVLFIVSCRSRDAIFQPEARGEAREAEPEAEPLPSGERFPPFHLSGGLTSEKRELTHFVSVPATFAGGFSRLEFESVIDTSVTYQAIWKVKRIGTWSLVFFRHDVDRLELGTQFFGLSVQPAIRFWHRDPEDGGKRRTVLSFSSEAERSRFFSQLGLEELLPVNSDPSRA